MTFENSFEDLQAKANYSADVLYNGEVPEEAQVVVYKSWAYINPNDPKAFHDVEEVEKYGRMATERTFEAIKSGATVDDLKKI